MREIPIYQVDAFTSHLFAGNPAAVMLFDAYPDDTVLRNLAAENNLSETAFLVRDGNDYRIRWFTPVLEVPLCGHGTLASAAVVMERLEPSRSEVVFHSASGPLTVRRSQNGYVMNFPVRTISPLAAPPRLDDILGATPLEVLSDGFNYLAVLKDADTVRELKPDLHAIARLDRPGVLVTALGDGPYDCVSRYFAPAKGVPEDPVTGAAHCGLTAFWAARLGKQELFAYQASKRGGELRCRLVGERVELEGACVFYLEGKVAL